MKNNIIEILNLEKTYVTNEQSLTVLSDLSLKIKEGTQNAIVGRSGNGKSTLLNILSGIDSFTSGTVKVAGFDLSKMTEKDLCNYRANYIGLIFQFHYLLKDFTALENIFLPSYMTGKNKKLAIEKAESLLNEVGLYERKNHLPSELSGGERQRIAVARSLINDPHLILADEPTGNLDPENAELISDLLYNVSEKHNKTLLLVTHDEKVAKKAQVIYKLADKKITLDRKK